MTNLATYLQTSGRRQADFAKDIGVGQPMVSKLVTNAVTPSLEVAVAIERATDGAVPAASWIDAKGAA